MKTITKVLSATFTLGVTALFSQAATFAGNGTQGYSGDGGPATSAQLNQVSHCVADASGNFYIADVGNYDVRKVNSLGIISTYAGNQTSGSSGDGGLATSAQVNYNFGIYVTGAVSFDGIGNLYILEDGKVRKVTPSGIITTIAGGGASTADGVLATTADLTQFRAFTVDASGNVYVCNSLNSIVRKINTLGVINTIAGISGSSGFSGDGGLATAAQLSYPGSLVIDASGNLYIADHGNARIRKVNMAGIISTIAGTGTSSDSGDGGLATSANIGLPTSLVSGGNSHSILSFNNSNELHFACNSGIRKINSAGIISTAITTAVLGYTCAPTYIYIDAANNLYFTPTEWAFSYVKIIPGAPIYKVSLTSGTTGIEALDFNNKLVQIYPNPSNGIFTIESTLQTNASVEVFDITGKLVHAQNLINAKNELNLNLPAGNYTANIKANGVTINKKIVITK